MRSGVGDCLRDRSKIILETFFENRLAFSGNGDILSHRKSIWRDGRAAKATVCKTGSGGFNSHSRLHFVFNPRTRPMYYVYILHLANNQLYTGYTADLKRRLHEHQNGKSDFTSKHLPVKLIHYEAYALESDARRREHFLKTTEGKRLLHQQLRDLLSTFPRTEE